MAVIMSGGTQFSFTALASLQATTVTRSKQLVYQLLLITVK